MEAAPCPCQGDELVPVEHGAGPGTPEAQGNEIRAPCGLWRGGKILWGAGLEVWSPSETAGVRISSGLLPTPES